MTQHNNTPRSGPDRSEPAKGALTESEKGAACGIVDWRSVSFVMVDSPQAKVHEDAVAAERFD
ncbi:MAG: hypothetical protein RL518_2679, partial [Pseudomonadota bacterium]